MHVGKMSPVKVADDSLGAIVNHLLPSLDEVIRPCADGQNPLKPPCFDLRYTATMENYPYAASFPESGDSSPRSREIDFENPPPWEEQPPSNNYKVKFMCSYGGKIHPRPNDNQLSYMGGETKILAVDRNIKFSAIVSKLSALCDADVCFKYQLPGEDLDALISVTNDDDMEHMMHEYDRLCRASAKPARLRLFMFPVNPPAAAQTSLGSNEVKSDRELFVDALNSGPIQSSPPPSTVAPPNQMDFLFGLDKGMPPPVGTKLQDQIPEPVVSERETPVPASEDRVVAPDPTQRQIQDLQRLQIGGQEQAMYRRKSDDNLVGGFSGDYYVQKLPEIVSPPTLPMTVQQTVSPPAGYWQENQIVGGGFQATTPGTEQQVYMIPAPTGMYHAQMGRPVTGPTGQGYFTIQRMHPDLYRDQPMYNVGPPVAAAPAPTMAQSTLPPQPPPKVGTAYSEGIGMVRPPTTGGMGMADAGYAAMAYDSGMGRQVYYPAAGQVMQSPYQAMAAAAVSTEMRPAGALNQEGKVVGKVSQTTM
ncbi:hypothetical protein F0562_028816 [Nyssa sinensis]|uniref:PB1 domain-containing protein n=1 Tax=Nyssa sinensis TaxID=561372 RepID=A0A5J5B161_9ASTE|nr:hypothetical protein F0562_028816 [Nyssa sinensis]